MSDAPDIDDVVTSHAAQTAKRLVAEVLGFVQELNRLDCRPHVVQFKVDGLTYTSTKLPCSVGLEVFPRVLALMGAPFTRAIMTGQRDGIDASAIVRLADRAMRDGLLPLVHDLLRSMKCGKLRGAGGVEESGDVLQHFDSHFAGEYGHLAKVCAFSMAHNFRGPTYGGR